MTEVWIVQPYIPRYRVPFFEGLGASLRQDGIDLRIVAGRPSQVQDGRGDAAQPTWLTATDDRLIHLFGRSLTLTRTRRYWRRADAVIVPHMGSSLDALSALARKSSLRVGVWGHIASYTAAPHPIDQAIERWQLGRADHVFAYTPGGARYAESHGVSKRQITVVMNSTDTRGLSHDLDALSESDLAKFRVSHGIPSGRLFAYLGGLDASKRVDLLADALDELYRRGSDVHVVVGGSGTHRFMLDTAISRGQVTMLGYVDGIVKAAILKSAVGILNPGRVGLLAVDALAANRPILSTDWPYHAPEVEYLSPGTSFMTCADDAIAFANLIEANSGVPNITANVVVPSIEAMIENFRGGVIAMLAR